MSLSNRLILLFWFVLLFFNLNRDLSQMDENTTADSLISWLCHAWHERHGDNTSPARWHCRKQMAATFSKWCLLTQMRCYFPGGGHAFTCSHVWYVRQGNIDSTASSRTFSPGGVTLETGRTLNGTRTALHYVPFPQCLSVTVIFCLPSRSLIFFPPFLIFFLRYASPRHQG